MPTQLGDLPTLGDMPTKLGDLPTHLGDLPTLGDLLTFLGDLPTYYYRLTLKLEIFFKYLWNFNLLLLYKSFLSKKHSA